MEYRIFTLSVSAQTQVTRTSLLVGGAALLAILLVLIAISVLVVTRIRRNRPTFEEQAAVAGRGPLAEDPTTG